MFNSQAKRLKLLRYHAPTSELRESFYIRGNNIFCSKPSLLEAYDNDTNKSEQELEIYIKPYIRKAAKNIGTGRRKVRGYKRKLVEKNY